MLAIGINSQRFSYKPRKKNLVPDVQLSSPHWDNSGYMAPPSPYKEEQSETKKKLLKDAEDRLRRTEAGHFLLALEIHPSPLSGVIAVTCGWAYTASLFVNRHPLKGVGRLLSVAEVHVTLLVGI